MPRGVVTSERERIALLEARDGRDATREWVRGTLASYREAVNDPGSHASHAPYRPRFLQAIAEFEAWLASEGQSDAKDG